MANYRTIKVEAVVSDNSSKQTFDMKVVSASIVASAATEDRVEALGQFLGGKFPASGIKGGPFYLTLEEQDAKTVVEGNTIMIPTLTVGGIKSVIEIEFKPSYAEEKELRQAPLAPTAKKSNNWASGLADHESYVPVYGSGLSLDAQRVATNEAIAKKYRSLGLKNVVVSDHGGDDKVQATIKIHVKWDSIIAEKDSCKPWTFDKIYLVPNYKPGEVTITNADVDWSVFRTTQYTVGKKTFNSRILQISPEIMKAAGIKPKCFHGVRENCGCSARQESKDSGAKAPKPKRVSPKANPKNLGRAQELLMAALARAKAHKPPTDTNPPTEATFRV